ncbi:MAG: hypothetical protein ABIT36_08420 [Steroidobacteraceae bacterium]
MTGRRLGWLTPRHAGFLLPAIAICIVVVTWFIATLVGRAFM